MDKININKIYDFVNSNKFDYYVCVACENKFPIEEEEAIMHILSSKEFSYDIKVKYANSIICRDCCIKCCNPSCDRDATEMYFKMLETPMSSPPDGVYCNRCN